MKIADAFDPVAGYNTFVTIEPCVYRCVAEQSAIAYTPCLRATNINQSLVREV